MPLIVPICLRFPESSDSNIIPHLIPMESWIPYTDFRSHRDIYDETSMYYHANLEQQALESEVALQNPEKVRHEKQSPFCESGHNTDFILSHSTSRQNFLSHMKLQRDLISKLEHLQSWDLLRTHIFPRTRETPKPLTFSKNRLWGSKNRSKNKYLSVFETKQKNVHMCNFFFFLHICKVFEKKIVFSEKIFATELVFERFLAS
ncbi:hypothetical protein LXL04_035733 [Taraxacum kok-saghyz]